jgi:Domain of unknown function (DUF5615)
VAEAIRFYLDQHQSHALAAGLRARGIDVLMAQEAGRCGDSDADQLAFATAEGRVMVTFDPDFLTLHGAGTPHAGIAWCPATKYGVGQLIDALVLVYGAMTPDEMMNHVEYL